MITRDNGFVPSLLAVLSSLAVLLFPSTAFADDALAVIERVKTSVVAIGTFQRTRVPAFQFLATGFAVDNGLLIVTCAHALPPVLDGERRETIAILLPGTTEGQSQIREVQQIAVDRGSDLAVLKADGRPLPALKIRDADNVREGQSVLFTGFPIGSVLGPYPATHRGMVAAITPIAIPSATSDGLDSRVVHRLTSGSFPVFQLDATAYPGNSGSPLYDPASGEVIGILNMVFVKGTKEAALTQPSGITYAIPSKHLRDLLRKTR